MKSNSSIVRFFNLPNKPTYEWFIIFAALFIFSLALGIVIPTHEPWSDESQAWLLARDSSITDLFFKYLRYEGSPGLWHLILILPAKLGAPFFVLNLISGFFALVTAALIMIYAPFPLFLRLLLPFTYFIFYQYGVVARSYSLLGPTLFGLAIIYPNRNAKYGLFTLFLILLSNVTLHGMIISGWIFFFEIIEKISRWNTPEQKPFNQKILRYWAILVLNYLCLIGLLWPPADVFVNPLHFVWNFAGKVARQVYHDVLITNYFLTTICLLCFLLFFYQRRVLALFLCLYLSLVAFFCFKYFAVWHIGAITLFLFYCYWIACTKAPDTWRKIPRIPSFWISRAALYAMSVTCVFQIYDSAMASYHDYYLPYSSALETAEYIKENGLDKKTINAFDYNSFSVLPYFNRNFFTNFQNHPERSFWVWSNDYESHAMLNNFLEGDPNYLLVPLKTKTRVLFKLSGVESFNLPGYRIVKVFHAALIWKDSFCETDSMILYKRDQFFDQPSASPNSNSIPIPDEWPSEATITK